MNTILLTGATGFLGSYTLKELITNNYEVIVVKRTFSNCWRINDFIKKAKVYDIDKVSIDSIFKAHKIDSVIHTATSYGRKDESDLEVIKSNFIFSIEMLETAKKNKVKSFVNIDTLQTKYLNTYTLSKKQFVEWGVKYDATSKIRFLNIKIDHLYGPKDDDSKFISWFINQLKEGVPEIMLTQGNQKRDFTYVKDLVNALMVIIKKNNLKNNYSEFEVGSGKSIEVRKFLLKIVDVYETINEKKIETKLNFGAIDLREGEPMDIKTHTDFFTQHKILKTKINDGILSILK